MPPSSQDKEPFPLSDTLRDLAVLRTSDIDLSSLLLPEETGSSNAQTAAGKSEPGDQDKTLERSYQFVKEARAAIRILHRGEVDEQGTRIDNVRSGLEDIANGLSTKEL